MTPPDTCQAIRDDLVAHLDLELSPARSAEVVLHLSACAACDAIRDGLVRTWKRLDLLEVPKAVDAAWLDGLAGKILAEADAVAPALRVLPGGAGSARSARSDGLVGAPAAVPGREEVARPAPASASRRLAIAAAALLAAGLTWAAWNPSGRSPDSVADRPLRPDHPAPRDPGPLPPPTPGATGTVPGKVPPASSEHFLKDPAHPGTGHERASPATPLHDPFEGLPPEEIDLVRNLDVLEGLAEFEDLQTIEALDVLDDLDPEELDEG